MCVVGTKTLILNIAMFWMHMAIFLSKKYSYHVLEHI